MLGSEELLEGIPPMDLSDDESQLDDSGGLSFAGLITCGLVTQAQFEEAKRVAFLTAYSIGEVLVAMEAVTADQLRVLMEAQIAKATPVIQPTPPRSSCTALSEGWHPSADFESEEIVSEAVPVSAECAGGLPGSKDYPARPRLRVGELLAQAKLITEQQLTSALVLSYMDKRKLGEIITSCNYVSPDNLELALKVQCVMQAERMSSDAAVAVLQHASTNSCSIGESLIELGYSSDATVLAWL